MMREREWIAACLRGKQTGPEWLNEETIIEVCQEEGVGPLLYTAISRGKVTTIPLELRDGLKAIYLFHHFRNVSLLQELERLLILFQEKQVPLILLKGAALLAAVYDEPAHRPLQDIDLLIREEDLEKAHLLILNAGYRLRTLEYWPWWRRFGGERGYLKNGIGIDLHWRLDFLGDQYSPGEIFSRSGLGNIYGAEALIPSPEDFLLHLLHHMLYQHLYPRLIWLFDIFKITEHWEREIDWERFSEKTKGLGLYYGILSGLRQVKELWGAPVPDRITEDRAPDAGWPDYFLRFQGKTSMGGNIIKFLRLSGLRNKLLFLIGAIFPSPTFLSVRYHTSSKIFASFYYFFRPLLIVSKCLKDLYKSGKSGDTIHIF